MISFSDRACLGAMLQTLMNNSQDFSVGMWILTMRLGWV